MTIGILLKRLQSALSHQDEITWFDSVSHIVLDEVHERDLDTDLLLVILKRMLKTRKAAGLHVPKILLMSATINADLFRNYFKNDRGQKAPLIDVPGKTYPVTRNYLDGFIGDLQHRSNAAGSWVFQVRVGDQARLLLYTKTAHGDNRISWLGNTSMRTMPWEATRTRTRRRSIYRSLLSL